MARIRSIHPGLFTDEAFVTLSMSARVFLMGLWTECDDQGAFEWKPISLKMRLMAADNVDIGAMLTELERANIIMSYEHQGRRYGLVRNFKRYQRPKKPNSVHFIPEQFRTYAGSGVVSSELEDDEPAPVPPKSENSPQMEDGGGREEGELKEPPVQNNSDRAVADATRPDALIWFEEFWKVFPNREGANPKHPALKAFLRSITDRKALSQQIAAEITAAANRYASECRGTNPPIIGTRSVARALTWLNEKRWQDYPASKSTTVENLAKAVMPNTPEFQKLLTLVKPGSFHHSQMVKSQDTRQPYYPPPHLMASIGAN